MKGKSVQITLLTACLFLSFFIAARASATSISPTDMIKSVVEQTFHALKTYPVDGTPDNLQIRRGSIRKIIDANFDSVEMSMRALGKNWKDLSEEKRQEFIKLFYWRLYTFYILKVETYSNEKVHYIREKISGQKAAVLTRVSGQKYPEFDIEYRMRQSGETWKIYDVVIEGVSLVANYRSQFDSFLSKKTFDELLSGLRDKAPDSDE
ncbi:MAG: ABC transporter substrate-binding protein [Desulfobulbaceae bacterium]|nr:ABC transporter substrate-binding protein [Desulfobulbaceae bacterium]